ncbi:MAG: carbamoyltransferase HypF [Syntrophotaleaceae bacterium]
MKRVKVHIQGNVQGVGFRPFVYRLAHAHLLTGWVMNTPAGVVLEAQGEPDEVRRFLAGLVEQAPPLATISSVQAEQMPLQVEQGFVIQASGGSGEAIQIAPDGDVCADCLKELFDPTNRRYRYPFINCTNCGPRYSIIQGVPYDRTQTTMAPFALCDACRAEYEDPLQRRFHAQPNACPDCGPQLHLLDNQGRAVDGDALSTTIKLLRAGKILAIKGLGGYHLAVDAGNPAAVSELRKRKQRDQKPFALMTSDLATLAPFAVCDATAARLLQGPERPIVLLPKKQPNLIAEQVAPGNGYFGVMLPATPLHHLLLRDQFSALVMTSGNLSDEPICYRDADALSRLASIADYFLSHNREIHIRNDDSVIRVFRGQPVFMRRSRGYAPRPIRLPAPQPSVLAVGAEMKGTICLTRGDQAFLSQHLGDLQNAATLRSLGETVEHLRDLLKIQPQLIAHDLHPDYLSTRFAESLAESLAGLPTLAVQHHHAHLASCMAEHGLEGEVIGVICDGTGFGSDGTIWGGEFLVGGYESFERHGHLRPLPMPGGDAAVREPWRMALAWLHSLFGAGLFEPALPCTAALAANERKLFLQMLGKGLNSPLTSSCGRLFDAVASLLGVRQTVAYEGQAAIELEALAERSSATDHYPFSFREIAGRLMLDFNDMLRRLVEEVLADRPREDLARRFHNTLALAASEVCEQIRAATGLQRVVLSGGVFQNRLFSEGLSTHLEQRNFQVFSQRLAPPNDGGLALGQALIAGRSNLCV